MHFVIFRCLLSALAALVISSSILDIVRQFQAQSIASGINISSDLHIYNEDANAVTEREVVSEHTPLLRLTTAQALNTEIIEPNDGKN